MLAAIRGGGLGEDDDSSGSGSIEGGDGEHNTLDVLSSLILQGADINAQTDRSGTNLIPVIQKQSYKRRQPDKIIIILIGHFIQ